MTSTKENGISGSDIRSILKHPVVDADGHMVETTFAILDFVKKVGGTKIASKYESYLKANSREGIIVLN